MINSNFISAISGGFIGGAFTYWAVRITIQHEREKSLKNETNEIQAICLAIETELQSLLTRYKNSIGDTLMECEDGKPFDIYYLAEEDYFVVFHANTTWIGKIASDETRNAVVSAYISMKGLLDTYRYNNQMLDQYHSYLHQALTLPQVHGQQQKFLNDLNVGYLKRLVEYVPTIKESHQETMKMVNGALISLRSYCQ